VGSFQLKLEYTGSQEPREKEGLWELRERWKLWCNNIYTPVISYHMAQIIYKNIKTTTKIQFFFNPLNVIWNVTTFTKTSDPAMLIQPTGLALKD